MSDETQAPQAEAPVPPKQTTIDDIRTINDLRQLMLAVTAEQTAWAQNRIQQTGYVQAVQAELGLNRTDLLGFAVHGLLKLLDAQQAEIIEINKRLVDFSTALVTLAGNRLSGRTSLSDMLVGEAGT